MVTIYILQTPFLIVKKKLHLFSRNEIRHYWKLRDSFVENIFSVLSHRKSTNLCNNNSVGPGLMATGH